jgi:hypothetical protein
MNNDKGTLRRRLPKTMRDGNKELLSTKLRIKYGMSLTYLNPWTIIQDHPYHRSYLLVVETQSVGNDIPLLTVIVKINAYPPCSRHPTFVCSDMAGMLIRETAFVSTPCEG